MAKFDHMDFFNDSKAVNEIKKKWFDHSASINLAKPHEVYDKIMFECFGLQEIHDAAESASDLYSSMMGFKLGLDEYQKIGVAFEKVKKKEKNK